MYHPWQTVTNPAWHAHHNLIMAFTKSNGINIHYQLHGNGETLILISGLGGDLNFWESSIDLLSKSYQLLIFDTRGSGKTQAATGPCSMEILANDLLGLMDSLNISKAHILGFSMGGAVALTFAHRYPERVSNLIIAASFAVMNAQIRLFLDAVEVVFKINLSSKQMFELIVPWLFSPNFMGQPENNIYLQFDENDPDQQSFEAWQSQYRALREFNISHELSSLLMPTMIIAGGADRLAHLEDSMRLAEGISNSQLVVIADVGHLINFEQPELFHKTIIDFLKQASVEETVERYNTVARKPIHVIY